MSDNSPGELIDILDENGIQTGIVKPRAQVHRDGDWHTTVHIWLYNGSNSVLLQRRSKNKESFPGLWDISAAGHICAGDTPRSSALRECSEELGLDIADESMVELFAVRNSVVLNNNLFFDNEISHVFMVISDKEISEMNPDSQEVDELRWWEIEDIRSALLVNDRQFVPHWKEYLRIFAHIESI